MKKRHKLPVEVFLLLILLIVFETSLSAAGSTSGEVLLLNTNAALTASGNAGAAALDYNAHFISLNPAHISYQKNNCVSFSFNKYIESVNQHEIVYLGKIKNRFYGISVAYLDYGDFQRTLYNELTGNVSFAGDFTASDIIIKTYVQAFKFYGISTGVSLKYLREKIEDYKAGVFMADAGAIYPVPETSLSLGASFQNIGGKMKFDKESFGLPELFRIGVSYNIPEFKLNLNLDWQKIKSREGDICAGVQFQFNKSIGFNAGYNGANDAGKGYTAGFNLNISSLELLYAFEPFKDFDSSHRITLVYNF
ncbi:MAG TPA: PorV/PorQ family protein [bacterium]|nr:PorV/PorQ family protein [bacterium]HPN31854.1 PorV/PorQ family protein [bacterium]